MKHTTAKWQILLGLMVLAVLAGVLGLVIRTNNVHAIDRRQLATNEQDWTHLSTANGDLPNPSGSTQQVLTLVADLDNDGVNDFIIGSRRGDGASLVWYHREGTTWTRYIIDSEALQLEAGGAYFDVDRDGDLDIVAGSNAQSNEIWWWENPYPDYSTETGWTRRHIKNSGATKHHDMMFGNFDDDPATELVFWNQNDQQLILVEIPAAPHNTEPWPDAVAIFDAPDNKREGLAQADVDGDGKIDIIGGGYWFRHESGTTYEPNIIEDGFFMRVAAGQLIPGGRPEIVQIPGDADGVGRWFEWDGSGWTGRDLPVGTIRQGHSLEIADANADGSLDIFIGEMRFEDGHANANPDARTLLLLGDGQGNFTVETVATGFDQHESRLADLDGDGDLDILGKPFTWTTPRIDVWLNNKAPSVCETPLAQWNTHVIDAERPYRAVFVDAADVDGDGLRDIITGAWWYRNPGLPGNAWQRHEIGAPLNQMAVVADFDEDGDIDILGTLLEDGAPDHQLHRGSAFVWARNDGAGNFEILDNIEPGEGDFLQGALLGTFGSGNREVMLSWHNRSDTVQSLTIPGDPAAEQWTIRAVAPLSQSEDLSAGDIDGDGDDDLLLGTLWLENDGGAWTPHTLFDTTSKPDRNRLADVNGDGRLDAVVGYEAISQPGVLAWYEAPIDPSQPWVEHVIDTIIGPMSIDVADLDGDGDADIVAGEHAKSNPTEGQVFVYENTPTGFQRHLVAIGDEHHDGTQLVDIDNDGDLDVISIGWEHGRVLLYEHTGCLSDNGPTPTASPSTTSTMVGPPTETPSGTPPIEHTLTPMATAPTLPSATPLAIFTPTIVPSPTPAAGARFYYVSSTSGGLVGGVRFADEDVLRFDSATATWSLFFDGSDAGLGTNDVDGFFFRPDGTILLSLNTEQRVGNLGLVDDSDILRFEPVSLGENTAGSFGLYFDGSDVGLATNTEDINVLVENAAGHLLISTNGAADVPGLSAEKWDLMRFSPAANGLGSNTKGSWEPYLRGSAIGLSEKSEGIVGAALVAPDHLYLTTQGAFNVYGLSGGATDVFDCRLTGTDAAAGCSPDPRIIWRGGAAGFGSEIIDSFAAGNQ